MSENKNLKKNNIMLTDVLNEAEARCREAIQSKDRMYNQAKDLNRKLKQLKNTVKQLKATKLGDKNE